MLEDCLLDMCAAGRRADSESPPVTMTAMTVRAEPKFDTILPVKG
jgi:hypothetical protein